MSSERGLDVSIVLYHSDPDELRATLESLRQSFTVARSAGLVDRATVWLIDNGSDDPAAMERLAVGALEPGEALRLTVLRGHGNIGFGAGHDLALARPGGAWHLVLNPDVLLDPAAIAEGIRFLHDHPDVGLVTPRAVDPQGRRLFLCKRYPSLLVLGLRGFAPEGLRARFKSLLDRYEMRDLAEHEPATGIPIASGCFMLARAGLLRAVGGFSSRYFLYFEDFDLSLRFRRVAEIAYAPSVRIVHAGGDAARKGWMHQRRFVRSAVTFFSTHGWKLW
ncbi:MAG TPA: glycosyltransferase family 2 protein [Gemmatimonadales bacterium]|nr:glycosyltransferase family 2 protein [Gemmatimonadales bacterium]